MFLPILSGLIVSVDAFFIGLSLGIQKRCKFIYLVIINLFLFALCMLGFLVAGQIYESIPFDPDLVVGLAFILLGMWTILQFFILENIKKRTKTDGEANASLKTFTLVGFVMSVEAMLITMGITFIFLPYSTFIIPVTVALAHFGYSSLSFHLSRTPRMRRIPAMVSHIVSGSALIIYGLMALFVELDGLFM